MPRLPGFQPKNHYEAIASLTMSDAHSLIKVQTTVALAHCVATNTNKTYSSAWKSWLRVAEIFNYPVSCIQPYTHQPVPMLQLQGTIIQYISWQCGVCRLSPRSVRKTYLPGIAKTLDRAMLTTHFRESSKSSMVKCVLDGYRNIWVRQHPTSDSIKVPFTTVLAQEAIKYVTEGKLTVHGIHLTGPHVDTIILRYRLQTALLFGIFFLLRKSEYLTVDPTNRPRPVNSRALTRKNIAFYNHINNRILYSDIGTIPAQTIRLTIEFSKTDQLGLGRIVLHCRQHEPNVICIVTMMEHWISYTRDKHGLSESDSLWQIPTYPSLTGAVIDEVMKGTCDLLGLPRSKVSTHSLRYGGTTELAAAGFPQYIIAAYGGWTADSKAMRTYTCLTQPANALVSQHMSRAFLQRPAKEVVNDLLMHRFDQTHSSSNSDSSECDTSRSTLPKRKGGKSAVKKRGK